MHAWANEKCSGNERAPEYKAFCSAAEKIGLWDTSPPPGAGIILAIVAPDVEAWKRCGKAKGRSFSCPSAFMDLPIATPLKSLKILKELKRACVTKGHSFVTGTQVQMADGSSKLIVRSACTAACSSVSAALVSLAAAPALASDTAEGAHVLPGAASCPTAPSAKPDIAANAHASPQSPTPETTERSVALT